MGVPGTPQQHQEGPRGRPGALKGAPRSVWERAEATKMEGETHGMKHVELLAHGSLAKRRPSNVLPSFLDFAFFCRACEPSKVLRLPANTKVRHCAQRVESPAPWQVNKLRKTSKTEAKIDPKSSKMACRARPGGLVAQLSALEGLRASGPMRPSSPTRPDRASQGGQAARGGQIEPASASQPVRARALKAA